MSKRIYPQRNVPGETVDIFSSMMRAQRRLRPVQRSSSSSKSIIAFYDGTGMDFQGRSLLEVLSWDTANLEWCHDYIQVLFPLPEGSMFNDEAPLIDQQVFETFQKRIDLRKSLLKAFQMMLQFYGFHREVDADGAVQIVKGANYNQRAPQSWNRPMDHNHQRISRIIRSLRILGLEEDAVEFHNALTAGSTLVAPRTREFWRKAAFRSLNLAPNARVTDEQDDTVGPEFLRDYVRTQKKKLNKSALQDEGLDTVRESATGKTLAFTMED